MQKSLAFDDKEDLRRARIRENTKAVGITVHIVAVAKNPTWPGNSIGIVDEAMMTKEDTGGMRSP